MCRNLHHKLGPAKKKCHLLKIISQRAALRLRAGRSRLRVASVLVRFIQSGAWPAASTKVLPKKMKQKVLE